jgi:hypothetical protein
MDTNYLTVVLNSSAPNVVGNEANFVQQLTSPMILKGQWEACMVNVTFDSVTNNLPAGVVPLGPTQPRSVFVLCDLLDNSTVGNNEQPLLFLTHPVKNTDPVPQTITHVSTITQWKKVAKSTVSSIRITLQDTWGVYTTVGGFPTTVQMILRQVSD